MAFNYKLGLKVQEEIRKKGGVIKLKELANLLRRYTNTMSSWWIRAYVQSMIAAELIEPYKSGYFKIKGMDIPEPEEPEQQEEQEEDDEDEYEEAEEDEDERLPLPRG